MVNARDALLLVMARIVYPDRVNQATETATKIVTTIKPTAAADFEAPKETWIEAGIVRGVKGSTKVVFADLMSGGDKVALSEARLTLFSKQILLSSV